MVITHYSLDIVGDGCNGWKATRVYGARILPI